MVDAAGITYAFRMEEELAAQPGRRGAGVRGRHRGVRPARAVGAPGRPGDPDRGVGPGGAGVAAAARPRRRAGSSPTGPSPWPSARRSPGSPRRCGRCARGCRSCWSGASAPRWQHAAASWRPTGVDAELALEAAALLESYGLLDIVELVELADREKEPREPFEVAQLYYAMSEHLGISVALTAVSGLERGDRWHSLARLALRDDLYGSLRAVTLDALREAAPGTPVDEAIAQWEQANASRLLRARPALDQMAHRRAAADLATLSVVVRTAAAARRLAALRGCAACPASSRRSRCAGPTRTPTGTSTTPRP